MQTSEQFNLACLYLMIPSIHPSIFIFIPAYPCRVTGGLEPTPADTGQHDTMSSNEILQCGPLSLTLLPLFDGNHLISLAINLTNTFTFNKSIVVS